MGACGAPDISQCLDDVLQITKYIFVSHLVSNTPVLLCTTGVSVSFQTYRVDQKKSVFSKMVCFVKFSLNAMLQDRPQTFQNWCKNGLEQLTGSWQPPSKNERNLMQLILTYF